MSELGIEGSSGGIHRERRKRNNNTQEIYEGDANAKSENEAASLVSP